MRQETGYRPRALEHVLTFQPMAGSTDSPHELYLARGADRVGTPDPDEAEAVAWIPLGEIPGLIADGALVRPMLIVVDLVLAQACRC